MRVAVLDRQTPFAARDGGAPAGRLCHELRREGHEAELMQLPFDAGATETIVDQMLAVRLLVVEDVDRVIAVAFPAYHVRHDDRIVWALDDHGALVDCLPNTVLGRRVRRAVLGAARSYLGEARAIHAPSAAAAQRLRADTGLDAQVLAIPHGGGWAEVVAALTR